MARAVTESALMAALSFLLYVGASIPFVGAFCVFLCPVPITFVGVYHGHRRAALACLCTTVLVSMLTGGFTQGYLYLTAFGVFGLATGWMLTYRGDMGRALMIATFALTLLLGPLTFLIGQSLGASEPIAQAETALFKFVDEQVAKLGDPHLSAAMPQLKAMCSTLLKFPLLAFLIPALVGLYVQHWVTYKLFERLGRTVPKPPNPYHLKMAPWISCAFFAIAIRYGQVGGANKTYEASILLNLMYACIYLAWFAGISAVARMIWPKEEIPLGRYAALMIPGFLFGNLPMLIGLFDSFQPPAPPPAEAQA